MEGYIHRTQGAYWMFIGELARYVLGKRDDIPEGFNNEWRYKATLARQQLERERRIEAKKVARSKLTIA